MSAVAGIIAPLFVPANRPERFAKAGATEADAIILDLEDAVPAEAKQAARAMLDASFTDRPVIVRINAVRTPWHEADLAAVARLPISAIMLPKAESPEELARIASVHPVIALVESVRGIAEARALAASGHAARLAFGSVDYAADLGCAHEREALAAARAELVFAARLAGLPPPLDGVTTNLTDPRETEADALYARALGFGGKLVIHPRQVGVVLHVFRPAAAEVEWARRVVASGQGAVMVDGDMVDEPVRIRARAILDRVNGTAEI